MNAFDLIREKLEKEKKDKQAAYENLLDRKMWGLADVFMGKVSEVDDVVKIIDKAEKEYNNGWIPCSERLPEDGQCVLVQVEYKDDEDETSIQIRKFDAQHDGHNWKMIGFNEWMSNLQILAWQSLPD